MAAAEAHWTIRLGGDMDFSRRPSLSSWCSTTRLTRRQRGIDGFRCASLTTAGNLRAAGQNRCAGCCDSRIGIWNDLREDRERYEGRPKKAVPPRCWRGWRKHYPGSSAKWNSRNRTPLHHVAIHIEPRGRVNGMARRRNEGLARDVQSIAGDWRTSPWLASGVMPSGGVPAMFLFGRHCG